ncbi:ferredoxin [Actinoplanes bogorensis]|uniref:Ferredoxin n=1 Tax=Paractinoplanes bogorensis TaxID=1610840 RepID=A0ABS5Z1Q6_9ACTN|nr:ferredoxin [Actinoplanes bogorensis]MBU2668898.1 ferredoxin [Actinoplanes bogorensis]
MKVAVDQELCDGYGNCVMNAPEAFDLDDNDKAIVIADEVPDGDGAVERAVVGCPFNAISTH